ncbi:hypothetical protein RUND412_011651, partial [Rhizina undulata]
MSSQSNSPATLHNDSIEHSTTNSDGSHGLTGGASSSTLSSPPSILDPPVGFEHLESSNHGFDTGAASPNIRPPITPPPRRRTRLDPCVSPGMVEALRVSGKLDTAELMSKRSDERPSRSLRRNQPVRASNSKSPLLSKTAKTTSRKLGAKSGRFTQRHGKLSDGEVSPGETQLSNKQHVADDGPGADQMTPKASQPKRRSKQTWQWVLEIEPETGIKEQEKTTIKRSVSMPPSSRIHEFTLKLPGTNVGPKPGNEFEGTRNDTIRCYSEGASIPDSPPVVPIREKRIGILAETPIVTGRLRPRKPQAIPEATSSIARRQARRRRTPSIANSESEEESEEESEGEESEGTAI